MVTLLDVLQLPSCGFSSVPKIMRGEIVRGLARITDNTSTMDKDRLERILRDLSRFIKHAKICKEDFVRRKKVWLEAQILLVKHNLYFFMEIYKFVSRTRLTTKLKPLSSVVARLLRLPSPAVTTTQVASIRAWGGIGLTINLTYFTKNIEKTS